MNYVDLRLGAPFKDDIGIGRIVMVHDTYALTDQYHLKGPLEKLATNVRFRRQLYIQNLLDQGFYSVPVIAEMNIPGGLSIQVPSAIHRHRARLLTVEGEYRLSRLPMLQLLKSPEREETPMLTVRPDAAVELLLRSLDGEISESRMAMGLQASGQGEHE